MASDTEHPGTRRRAFLRGAIGAGVTGAVAGAAGGYAYRASRPPSASEVALENAQAGVLPPVPFHGRYQAGILPAPQRQTAVVAFSATADGRGELMTGQNIGNLLDARNVSWGWFQGGFAPTGTANGYEVCGSAHQNIGGNTVTDYVPHHDPFQYYKSTSNPKHLPPTSEAAIGHTDQANHQYDLSDFYTTLQDGNMPAVSFLKPAAYENGHPGNSDPLDEQTFLVNTINKIEASKFWDSTAIVITYDDSDGWYDHQAPPIVNGSSTSADTALCSSVPTVLGSFGDRCGFGQRLPMVVISPWTRDNYVSNNRTDTASVINFIEDNWLRGKRLGNGSYDAISGSLDGRGGLLDFRVRPNFTRLILNPTTGEVVGRF